MSLHLKNKMRRYVAASLIAAFGIFLTTAASWAETKPAFGTITLFAPVPAEPGFPEGVAVHGNSVFVSGPARFGTAGTGPSAIQVYNRITGQLQQTIVVQGEALAFEHALSNIAIDSQGRIYALSTQLGLIRFTKQGQSYQQGAYGAPLPDLPPPVPGPDFPPIPNDVVFDDAGYMSGEEQTFLMTELARLKKEGRIEVIRERSANFHVFAFVDAQRPADELITESLEEASGPVETNHATKTPAKTASKSRTAKSPRSGRQHKAWGGAQRNPRKRARK